MSAVEMAAITPRRSSRIPHNHTPKISERKKGLFQCGAEPPKESLTAHRKLPVLDSESDSEDCDLGIISTLDSSSCDEEQTTPKTPDRALWHETRGQMRKLRENYDLKTFMKSPFMLKKYQTRYSCPESCGSLSTPVTPHFHNHPGTPSSTHSCASAHTTSSTSSRARKSLASLIADTESCSSSLKDLNFDTDSGSDSKENTPTKSLRRSNRNKMTPKMHSFKGILMEQKKNVSPLISGISPTKQPVVCLTKMDMTGFISPSQILKTPNTTDVIDSPPKIGHNRRSAIEIEESPESTCDSEKSYKRLRNDSLTEAPYPKHPRLENAPKARLSLFNSDRLKDILSAKSFYGKKNPELNTSVATKLANAIDVTTQQRKALHRSHSSRHKRKPGQINLGVRHKIRKPKHKKMIPRYKNNVSMKSNNSVLNSTASSLKDASMLSQESVPDLGDRTDPFGKEKQTIEALLSQWEEEEIPESELQYSKKELPCFSKTVIEETSQIFQPVTAIPVTTSHLPTDEAVIIELGKNNMTMSTCDQNTSTYDQIVTKSTCDQAVTTSTCDQNVTATYDQVGNLTSESLNVTGDVVMTELGSHEADHGVNPKSGQFLPVAGGYIVVEENVLPAQEELPDLDEIEKELRMLDEQILKMAKSNNIDADAVLASTETGLPVGSSEVDNSNEKREKPQKLFPIFSNPNPGVTPKGDKSNKKPNLKSSNDQYIIDAGQKKFGATQCNQCGTIYEIGNPQDEHDHLVHHNATDVLKFNGWKEECIIDRGETWRCIRVRGGESNWRRVETLLNRVIHPQLGYEGPLNNKNVHELTAYLYIEKKQIVGCLIAEVKTKAYKLLPGEPDCCSVEDYPVKCGISRLWTHINYRRRGIAKCLLDCARVSFLYGCALQTQHIAFSAPTAAGKAFATKYCNTPNFYVYLD